MQQSFDQIDPDKLAALIDERKWVPIAAIVVGLLVRLIKDDTRGPSIPAAYRIYVAFGLSMLSGVLEKVVEGRTWTSAMCGAFITFVMPVVFHETVVAGKIRDGHEFGFGPLNRYVLKEGARPSPTAPPTIPPGVGSTPPPPLVLLPVPTPTGFSEPPEEAQKRANDGGDKPPNNVD